MTSPDRSPAERLNDYLDAVVASDPTREHDLDPALAATIEHFFAVDDAPAPPPGLADDVWQELMDPAASRKFVPLVLALRPERNGRTAVGPRLTEIPNHHASRPHYGPSALAYLATAALLVLTLVGGLIMFRGSLLLVSPEQRAIILPASDITTERVLPSDKSIDGILLRSTLEQMPSQGGSSQLALYRLNLAPGAMATAGSQADTGVGADQFTVEAGRVTVEADAPVLVTRAVPNPAATPTLVEPGTAVVLDVGDQLYAPSGVSFRRHNDDLTPATLLGFSIGTVGDTGNTSSLPPGVTYVRGLPVKRPSNLPAAPVDTIVRRVTLTPGDELAVRDVPGLELVYVEAGTLDLLYAKNDAPATPEEAFTIQAGNGTETFGPTPNRAVLANRGADSLVILTASVVSTSGGEPTPEAPSSDGWGTGDHRPDTKT